MEYSRSNLHQPMISQQPEKKIQFLFTANKQALLQELSKGSIRRWDGPVNAQYKTLISEAITLPTIIFDEIDSGVSGDIGR